MERPPKRWKTYPPITPEAGEALASYPLIVRQLLYNRGQSTLEQAQLYLKGLQSEDTDPFKILGMPQAVERLVFAIQQEQPIAIYGDYDTDGVTATALLFQVLTALGSKVSGYIPNRFDEGYGLNNEALDHLRSQGVCLVVTVDCGIRSLAEARYARQIGLDMIITDHHHPSDELPEALAVINPKQPGDSYPEKELAGVGLAYKLATALLSKFATPPISSEDILDLVALGTVADLAPLVGENRSLVRAGLQRLRRPHRQGVMSLIGASGLQAERVTASDIGYMLAPRLNAAGRLESALAALELLTSSLPEVTGRLAQQLNNQNHQRQQITQEIQVHAEKLASERGDGLLLLFACDPGYNSGVVGLAASRLTDTFYRPSVVACKGEEYTRASCRSIPEFHITQALDRCSDLLVRHGGHAAAAGFTVANENLDLLVERLESIAAELLTGLDLRPVLTADIEIPLLELKPYLLEFLDQLEPTGNGNPPAAFISRNLKVVRSKPVGREGAHLKMTVTDGRIHYDAIAFNQGQWIGRLPGYVDLLYVYERNEYNGVKSLQLRVRDLKPSGLSQ